MNDPFYTNIGKTIQKLRREKNISQAKLAKMMGKGSPTYVTLIESGKRKVSVKSLTKISEALQIPLNVFFSQNYETTNPNQLIEKALISDINLSSKQKTMILEFIEFLRKRTD